MVGARSVLQPYSDAWFEAARRHNRGERAGFPRRKRFLVPIRFYHGTFRLDGDRRIRLPVAKGHPELWVRLARPLPYPPDQVRSVTLLHDGDEAVVGAASHHGHAAAVHEHLGRADDPPAALLEADDEVAT